MSASLIRKGLELLSDDIKDVGKSQKSKKKSTQKPCLMDQIGSNKQGVRKQLRRLQTHSRAQKNKTTVKDKHVKNALEEYRKKQKKSQLISNLEYFTKSGFKAQENCTKKILHHNAGRLSLHRKEKPVSKPKEKSVFTEDEFQKFQEEYFSKL